MSDPMDFDDSDWPAEWMNQNTEVYLALGNVRENPAAVISDFLRSDVPIHPLVRHALADAFDGISHADKIRFEVVGHPYGPNTPGGMRRLREQVAVADYVAARRAEGVKANVAEREAASHFCIGEDKAHKAISDVKKMRRWIADNVPSSEALGFDRLGVPGMRDELALKQYAMHLAGKLPARKPEKPEEDLPVKP